MHNGIAELVSRVSPIPSVREALARGYGPQHLHGPSAGHHGLISAALGVPDKPMLIITPGEKEAVTLAEDLGTLLPGRGIFVFPSWELLPVQVLAYSKHLIVKRIKVLSALTTGTDQIVVAPIDALARRLPPMEVVRAAVFALGIGETWDLGAFRRKLLELGYQNVARVESEGQFSSRGGILDVFPATSDAPVRIEFFGDELDSIRQFDPETQRSEKRLDGRVTITPVGELYVEPERWQRGYEEIRKDLTEQRNRLLQAGRGEASRRLEESLSGTLARIEAGAYFPGMEEFLDYFYPDAVPLSDYLPDRTLVLVSDPERVSEVARSFQKQRNQGYASLIEQGQVLPRQFQVYRDWAAMREDLSGFSTAYLSFTSRYGDFKAPRQALEFPVREVAGSMGRPETLIAEVQGWQKKNYAVGMLVGTADRVRKLTGALERGRIRNVLVDGAPGEPGQVTVTQGTLGVGFQLPNANLVILTETEIYGKKLATRKQPHRKAAPTLEELELVPGDYVVHVNHGIGLFRGIVPLEITGIKREYLLLKYHGEDKLYVPTDQLGFVQKYIGAEGEVPRLSRLGGSDWARTKKRVQEAVREMAEDLIKLYAARQSLPGYAFPADAPWQQEFELAFPHEETPDQLRAITEAKRDMERPRPMDRLLCGDVGYGKTEVAMRAAFKAVVGGKQVAVLVPTTVLAQQHFQNFSERFQNYGITVDVLSRFRSLREQRQVLENLVLGKVDIVIGTHRLVQEDVTFKNLGLVVIDEEQRFGVAHKERLKILHPTVDALTLTATPIPRTLYMSLVGVRDASQLQTPPLDRFTVQTYVVEEDPVLIREAITREMARGGQIYFVHNRVAELNRVYVWLQGLVPDARIGIGHGQLREDRLEQVMLDFVNGEYDILLCTTIIETGLDIANVNTLIVKDADQFGLAQLYQLRGRVGRSNRLAFAYFTYRRDRILGEPAEKRLRAIRDFTEFGSGYKLAKRDLEIRGAGNLLGTEQHGHVSVVGFEMYCRLLEGAVRDIKGEQHPSEEIDTVVELPITAFIPDEYIPDGEQKVRMYHALANVRQKADVDEISEELEDRFGKHPTPVRNLLAVARLRALARQLRVKSISRQGTYYRFVFGDAHPLDGEKLVSVASKHPKRLRFKEENGAFEIWLKSANKDESRLSIQEVEEFLGNIS